MTKLMRVSKIQWAIQVAALFEDTPMQRAPMLLEWLRYAGVVSIIKQEEREEGTWVVFQIHCPAGLDSDAWASLNSRRIRSYGYNAQPVRK